MAVAHKCSFHTSTHTHTQSHGVFVFWGCAMFRLQHGSMLQQKLASYCAVSPSRSRSFSLFLYHTLSGWIWFQNRSKTCKSMRPNVTLNKWYSSKSRSLTCKSISISAFLARHKGRHIRCVEGAWNLRHSAHSTTRLLFASPRIPEPTTRVCKCKEESIAGFQI